MEVPLTPETESFLRKLAQDAGRGAEEYAADLLRRLAEQDQLFRAGVERGIAQADRGDFIEEDSMDARVASWFAS